MTPQPPRLTRRRTCRSCASGMTWRACGTSTRAAPGRRRTWRGETTRTPCTGCPAATASLRGRSGR
eukprot:4388215-Prymnesium_polylepis.1